MSARIVALADAYDAMTSDRPYRNGLGKDEARRQLLDYSDSQFDPQLVPIFISVEENLRHCPLSQSERLAS